MSPAHRGGGMSSHSSASLALAAKVGLASAALAGAASLARLAVPHLVSAGGAVLPRLWAVARFWLAPPYLFVTVHLIILVIWKLSDHKHFHAHHHQKDPWPVSAHQHQHTSPPPVVAVDEVKVANKEEEEFGAYAADYSSPDFSPDSGGDSCVTTESDEDAASSSAASSSYYSSSMMEARRSVAVVAPASVLERELSLPASQTVDGGDDDDMDATWNAIMQKTRSAPPAPAPASPPPPAPAQQQSPTRPPPRARDPSVGAEEMNRRFDDFIKKNRNSFGRHQ
ncbi:hypothetical protein PR202_gb13932 [Eleusine coracana subsp. coracana]|uniref:DUF4408 domain-containing protein n=1 Tax=Eleusine coracana subsp. coracana TaxID=191504 RepID=A0AAV5EUZ2_ELECO|nr:hypothetical protein QOZ80_4BG0330170 [Eleusine coracana subsp. coracana]GJN26035.1 hypothetical protein PR202_gb13932 [Eleusine coracana subsp. coracana]